jgi:hypothetical protein
VSGKGPSQATTLVEMAEERYRLGQTDTEEPFAVPRNGPNIARMLRGSRSLRSELASLYFDEMGAAPSSSALTDTLAVLEGKAMACTPEAVALRVARHAAELVVDLGTEDGTVAVVSPGRWTITTASPVLFRRTKAMAALPVPARKGDLRPLRMLLNISDDNWPLIELWLVCALFPDIAHAVLFLIGEQGVAKSWAGKLCSAVVDPSPAQLRRPPTDPKDWLAQANASWCVCLDNLSTIQPWLSDAICRAVTGDGSVDRTLYTNADATVIAFRRVVALTSIGVGGLRGDLADRSMLLEQEPIGEDDRREDTEVAEAFAAQHARILGGLLDLVADVLAVLPDVRPARLPRMADVCRIAAAIDRVNGGEVEKRYRATVNDALTAVVEHDILAASLNTLLDSGPYDGIMGELLEKLTTIVTSGGQEKPPKDWPRTPRGLAEALKRLAPPLRATGITIEIGGRTRRGRAVQIVRE